MARTLSNVRLDGCLFGPPTKRDYVTVFDDAGAVPDRVDLRKDCTQVEDQGQIGSCTANASVGALEYLLKRRDGQSPHLSRMFVYYNSRRMRGQIFMDTGALIREAMASVMAYGACREDTWPYDPMLFAAEPPPMAYQEAITYEALQYARVDGGRGTIRALAMGFPVVFGTKIPMRCYQEAATTGVIPPCTADERDQPGTGGHSMLIVGYDNLAKYFILRNSWGEGWGDHGYCRISYDMIDLCCRREDFWVVAELEKKAMQGFTLVRPNRGVPPKWRWCDQCNEWHSDDDDEKHKPAGSQLGGLSSTTTTLREDIRKGLEADLAASSRKIDSLLSGRTGRTAPSSGAPRVAGAAVVPCTACAGSGVCPFCHAQKPGCVRCKGTGACAECGGTGVL